MTTAPRSKLALSQYVGDAIKLFADDPWVFVAFAVLATMPSVLKTLLVGTWQQNPSLLSALLEPVVFCVQTFFSICLIYKVIKGAGKEIIPPRDIVEHILTKAIAGIGGYAVYILAIIAGTFLLVIPGLYCAGVFGFFIFAILVEDKGLVDSFKRSHELVQARILEVFLAHILVFLVLAVIIIPFTAGMKMLGVPEVVATVVTSAFAAIIMPVMAGFYYFIYVALKEHKDGVLNIAVTSS